MASEDSGYEPESLQRLHDYWRSKWRGESLPSRRDIDPTDFPELLAHLILVDVESSGSGPRYRIRLTGTEFGKAFVDMLIGIFATEERKA